jgi:hypothetical protein
LSRRKGQPRLHTLPAALDSRLRGNERRIVSRPFSERAIVTLRRDLGRHVAMQAAFLLVFLLPPAAVG